jgi:hypothetical protein
MADRSEIEDTKHTVEALAKMARDLGYKSSAGQLYFNNGATASDLFEFFEDNPGACQAVVEWVLENGRDRDGNPLESEEDSEEEEEEQECCVVEVQS